MDLEKINRRIDECLEKQHSWLNLNSCEIKNLNKIYKLTQCTNLSNLNLDNNQILDYSFLEKLPNLTSLTISNNQILNYNSLEKLPNLTSLTISNNQILNYNFLETLPNLIHLTHLYISISRELSSLTYLNIKYNQILDYSFLEKLPNLTSLTHLYIFNGIDLSQLPSLTRLRLVFNQDISLNFSEGLSNLTHLNLNFNLNIKLNFLKQLSNLTTLNLSSNKISDFSFFKQLPNLTNLDVSSNKISDVSFLKNLPNLTDLNLSFNSISNISFFDKLPNLTHLNLSFNSISNISFFDKLPNLTHLNLSSNNISNISFFDKLPNLTHLNLYHNSISNTHFLKNLPKLTHLDLNENNILNFYYSKSSQNLIELELSNNKISNIIFLEKLPNLLYLSAKYNNISNVIFLEKTPNLIHLKLRYNNISNINLVLLNKAPQLEKLYLAGNKIKNIEEFIFGNSHYNCLLDLRNYLEDLKQGKIINNEVKILLVGNGSVGKTQMAKRLVEQEKFELDTQHNSTHAICLLERQLKCNHFPVPYLNLQLWDFAGQDLYHATHRLFMQTKALFFLVWDIENECLPAHTHKGKQYKNEEIDYWLHYIKHFGENSPILVLQNKTDISVHKERFYPQMAQKDYKKQYNIKAFLQVSAKTGNGFSVLERKIQEIFRKDKTLQEKLLTPLPSSWVVVRSKCREEMQKGIKSVDFATFEVWHEQAKVKNSVNILLSFLHNTGVVFYKENYFNRQIILNQAWAIEAIYKILDRDGSYIEILENQKGTLFYEDLCDIWPENNDAEKKLFINFMLSCEFCFVSNRYYNSFKEKSFVIPQLLPPKQDYIEAHAEYFDLQKRDIRPYDFLPNVYIQRFIVRTNKFADIADMWPSGILMYYEAETAYAIVEADYEQKTIVIRSTKNAITLRKAIWGELNKIEGEGKQAKKQLPKMTKNIRFAKDFLKKGFANLRPNKNIVPKYGTLAHKIHLEKLLIRGELESFINALLTATKDTKQIALYDKTIVQSARFHRNERDILSGNLSSADGMVERTRILGTFKDLLEEYKGI